ncbi:hypothetical protein [Actinomadura rubrisoli]|uniref:Uncharacterized protein n=1 Tax=Actinomadura rubrisoli TaxID=2530368 RepID=A0A4R5CFX3_9ACTN|nr:hypothetical protein [Actinomadura rubrisoli]TDD97183.1 hypothetical protein E1298_01740 [Actinomadura rubrisoli]
MAAINITEDELYSMADRFDKIGEGDSELEEVTGPLRDFCKFLLEPKRHFEKWLSYQDLTDR